MANPEHLRLLRSGVAAWNNWRSEHLSLRPDLAGAELAGLALDEIDLREADLTGALLRGTNLRAADLSEADLSRADLVGATLSGANLNRVRADGANLQEAKLDDALLAEGTFRACNLRGAWLVGARLQFADLSDADFSGATMSFAWMWDADLSRATLVGTRLGNTYLGGTRFDSADLTGAHLSDAQILRASFRGATLVGCNVYGAAVWDADMEGAQQTDLVITHVDAPRITVDDLKIAQFVYLLLNNSAVRDVIDTVTTKVVLILGRFSEERVAVLKTLQQALRQRNYVPILFVFETPVSKDKTGTVETLARMARFVVADLTDPSSVPHELATIVPHLRTTAVLPLRLEGAGGYSMFDDLQAYPWVLPVFRYGDEANLLASLDQALAQAELKVAELRGGRPL